MRLLPLVTAVLVAIALFFLVLQREALLDFARGTTGDAPGTAAPADETAPEIPVAIATEEAAEDRAPVRVVALRSTARDVPDAVLVRGQSEAAREVTVAAETTGTVVSEPIRKGAFVEAGQMLCELDPGTRQAALSEAESRLAEALARLPEAEARVPEAAARLAEAEARLEEARINQNAASRLSEDGFASETRVANAAAILRAAEAGIGTAETGLESVRAGIESARAAIRSAEAQVERAEREIANLSIEAPFAGLLETDTAELGTLLQPGSPCATVVQLDPLRLVGFLPEAQVDRVKVGARAGARLASGAEVTGEVTFLSRAADDMTRTFRVEVTVPNADLTIRDGQTAEILIETDATEAHLIPASALTLNDEGELGLRIVADGIVAFQPATLVRDTVDGVLLSGLPPQVDVITVGQEYVTEGVPVRVTFADDSPEVTQ
ncbi:efflux RND transporter periplasmic adaptor subunit [Jannaschia ovalis]|uniref:Efflux RND transporter periplasmic adaptor subunit n=1 Tax=Jannaschia ovalis TaxID=3038773 RepID=A0ABY8LA35_9RHOB|nr:efflux RND transporter periplasmic adaptor subunit [Jannaschia sp. GRR-S6-38]WGH78171.1 efflux RND transporter periplasmic adaptor subunit [Jannaschia sp. GRR-S6-38]